MSKGDYSQVQYPKAVIERSRNDREQFVFFGGRTLRLSLSLPKLVQCPKRSLSEVEMTVSIRSKKKP